ncbi:AAA-like domain-containing protein [Acaryochloris marina NIES-2412]|uniref:AAA-like domain-containing protein n=1 Tax=Acaryochloris marina TaxID=155978 RepID=UPI0040596081
MGSEIYTVGGTVQANEQGLYISRQADQDLLKLCRASIFAYVLTPRQMGKSSLMFRTAATLGDEGVQVVIVDLTQIGTQLTVDQWYLGLLTTIADQLMLSMNICQWWQERKYLGGTQRLSQFFEQVVLFETTVPVVIFIDEIDTTLTLGFADDFYAAIRGLYVARAKQPKLRWLSFVLIGVATPSDLIKDSKRTPFNVGERVELTDFTQAEALPMAAGLGLAGYKAEQVLTWVLKWTGGHPYLTQRLCKALVDEGKHGWQESEVDRIVYRTFLGEESEKDNNLQFVRDMLTKRAPEGEEDAVLKAYRDVRRNKTVVNDEEQSLVKSHLKLAGVVKKEGEALKSRNLIYQNVFDKKWIQKHLKESLWQRLRPAMPIITILLIFSGVTLGMAIYSDKLRRVALIREDLANTQHYLSTTKSSFSVVYAINAVDRSQSFPDVKAEAQSFLLKSIQRVHEVNLLQGHQLSVTSVSFSPDGKRIVSGSKDKTLRIWDARSGQPIGGPFQGHQDAVKSVSFSPDGKRIISGSKDKTLRIWDARSGQPIGALLQGHQEAILSVSFSPDGKRIVSGSGDNTVRLWDAQTGQPIGRPFYGHQDAVRSVSFSPDGKRIVSGSWDNTVRLWDAETGRPIGGPLQGHQNSVLVVSFSPDGNRVISGSEDKTLRLWDAHMGRPIGGSLQGHQEAVYSVSFSPDGNRIVSGSGDNTVRLWDVQRSQPIGVPLQGHQEAVYSVSFSPDGTRIASGSGDNTVRLWDAQTEPLIEVPLQGHQETVLSVSFSPNGKHIVSGSGDNTVRLWDAQTGQPIGEPLQGHQETVLSVSFSPDGTRIVSGSGDNTVRLWDAQTGQPIGEPLQGHQDAVRSASFSPDGKRIVSGSWDNTVRLWDAQTGQPIGEPLQGHQDAVNSVSFSPDGKRIISGSSDNTLHLWDAQTGQLIGEPLQGHQDAINSVSFSPDGKRIVSGSWDNTLRIWDVQKRQSIGGALYGHRDAVRSVSFSPDGKRIVSGSWDNTLRLWDVQTGQPIGEPLQGHQDAVRSVSFSPDGNRLISGSKDKTLRIWEVGSNSLTQFACEKFQHHPLLQHPETVTSEPSIIETAYRSTQICNRYVSSLKSTQASQL